MSKIRKNKIIEGKQVVKGYAKKLKENKYPFSAIYLFGSYSDGKAGKWSDIDVAVVSDKLKRNYWKNQTLLSRYSLKVDTRIEPHGFTKKEFMDNCNPMAYEIRKTGIRIV
ncbi:nucleotidyltransferase domain-containing protein [Patescibacteria group bacterium]